MVDVIDDFDGYGRCRRCHVLRRDHPDVCENIEATRIAVYGRANPMVQWLAEHVPAALREKAVTALDKWDSAPCLNPEHYPDPVPVGPLTADPRLHDATDGEPCSAAPDPVSAPALRFWETSTITGKLRVVRAKGRHAPYYQDEAVTIYHGDALALLPRLEADVLISDPDYGVGVNFTNSGFVGDLSRNVGRGGRPASECDELLAKVLTEANVQRNGLLFWSGSWKRIEAFSKAVTAGGWRIHYLGIWYKPNGAGPSGNGLARRFEPWFWVERGKDTTRYGEWNFLPDCIDVSRVVPGHREACAHPTQKPEELMRRLIRFFTKPGDTILDPFMGSGTTLRAAKDLGRKAIGIEINEEFCAMAVKRMAQGVLLTDEQRQGLVSR